MQSRLTDEEHQTIRTMYDVGASMPEICQATQRDADSVHRSLHKTGPVRTSRESWKLRRQLGLTTVHRRGSRLRPLDIRRFRTLDPDTAWLLGLAFGDGNVRDGGRFLLACGPDRDLAEKAAKILDAEATIGKRRECWNMEVYSKALVHDLATYGIIPAKTYCMKFPSIPADMMPHFVRGLWESDGSASVRDDGALALTYSTVSCCFANALTVALSLCAGVSIRLRTRERPPPRVNIHEVACGAGTASALARYMYAPAASHNRCDRKWGIVERFL
jgi:hypothetical protein